MEGKDLIKGAYDLHVHSAPDVLPRKMDDVEMAQRIIASGMAGYAIKSHYFCTSERAQIINEVFPGCDAIGTITLNSSVGGINPSAMEMAARSGAKLVWFPTCDSENEINHTFNGDPNKKMPYWAQIVMEMREQGIAAPTINILDENGKLIDAAYDVIDICIKYDIIIATGHLSHEEAFALIQAAHDRGAKKMVITHVDFPSTYYSIEDQKKFVSLGALTEHDYTTWATDKVDLAVTMDMIRQIGPENCILGTDLGQKTAVYPDEGMAIFADKLLEGGFTEEEIRTMIVHNPKMLLGKEE